MISEAELRRLAAGYGVDPMLLNLDYGIGWFLSAFYQVNDLKGRLRFKGGTCLRKAYFPDYRFSEDLDFTAVGALSAEQLLEWTEQAAHWAEDKDGPNFLTAEPRLELIPDEYGTETYQVRVYLRGPLRWAGSPQAIRLDVTRDEQLLLPAEIRSAIHPYSDTEVIAPANLWCYSLVEILAEKIRAIGGQRRFAISRDLYDIHRLVQAGVEVTAAIPLLKAKFAVKGLDSASVNAQTIISRRPEFEKDWESNLVYLIPRGQEIFFPDAWESTLTVLKHVEEKSEVSEDIR
jgi:predicted nucleotidyltransferase component of viral defense system